MHSGGEWGGGSRGQEGKGRRMTNQDKYLNGKSEFRTS